jgi:DNA-nicking Smr family endonuclease
VSVPGDEDPPSADGEGEPVELPIDGELDLHLFQPREVKALVTEYLRACQEKGVLDVRLVHGKGSGALRRGVLALLGRLPGVESFRPAAEGDGGWGATWVRLRPSAQDSQK